MLRTVDGEQAAREREARVAERNRRRAAKGKPTWEPAREGFHPSGRLAPGVQTTTPAAPREQTGAPISRRRIAHSTAIFSLATALSRVFGLVRQVVAAYYFGAT